jgi:sensor histidine kinase regulating citrate/malate metabolism
VSRRRRRCGGGEESRRDHRSGVGLWLVTCGVAHLGGRLSLDDVDPRGTVVTVGLPDDGAA